MSRWKIKLSSHDSGILKKSIQEICEVAKKNSVKFSVTYLFNKKTLLCLQRSPFIYGRSKDQYHFMEKSAVIFVNFTNTNQNMNIFNNVKLPAGVMPAHKCIQG